MTVAFSYTITDDSHYDAVPLMNSWDKIAEALNQGLDENNLQAGYAYSWLVLTLGESFNAPKLNHADGLDIRLADGKYFVLRDESGNQIMKVEEAGTVTIGE